MVLLRNQHGQAETSNTAAISIHVFSLSAAPDAIVSLKGTLAEIEELKKNGHF